MFRSGGHRSVFPFSKFVSSSLIGLGGTPSCLGIRDLDSAGPFRVLSVLRGLGFVFG